MNEVVRQDELGSTTPMRESVVRRAGDVATNDLHREATAQHGSPVIKRKWHRPLMFFFALVFAYGMWSAARQGLAIIFARPVNDERRAYLANQDITVDELNYIDKAIALDAANPTNYFLRAGILEKSGKRAEAIENAERAVRLSPNEFALWMKLGSLHEAEGDGASAEANYKQAIELAPNYAQPRWLYGNLLLRRGEREAAFAELREVARIYPTLLPITLTLAWRASDGDAAQIENWLKPLDDRTRLELAQYLVKQKREVEAMRIYRQTAHATDAQRQALINTLLDASYYKSARGVWVDSKKAAEDGRFDNQVLDDGGFEIELKRNQTSFGWRVARNTSEQQVALSTANKRSGKYALQIRWSGNVGVGTPLISQLVVVEANARYRISFAARTGEINTGGLPFVAVSAAGKTAPPLARSEALPGEIREWKNYSVEFVAPSDAEAVVVALMREPCAGGGLCPIFGQLWLDDFALEKLSGNAA